MHLPKNAELMNRIGELNQILDEKAFSWTLAMEDLETVLPSGVQVTTLEPYREKNGNTTLHLRVIGPRDRAVDLVRNLEQSRHFLLPRIVGESFETSGGFIEKLEPVSATNRVNFDLLAEYNPAAFADSIRVKEKPEQESVKAYAPAAEMTRSQPRMRVNNALAYATQPSAMSSTPGPSLNANAKKPNSPNESRRSAMNYRRNISWRERVNAPLPRYIAGLAAMLFLVVGLTVRLALDWAVISSRFSDALAGKQVE